MHIKQILIRNFKSFGEWTVLDPFHQRHNAIVGPNGGGKFNLFSALQFVLDNEFARLKVEQRKSLLHIDEGLVTTSGFVEIIFDNSDRRILFAEDEVSIRRTFNERSDTYTVNNAVVSRTKVMEAFEGSGFTIHNPYYLVEQGKINHLATMRDKDRLHLLKRVAGFESYTKVRSQGVRKLKIAKDELLKMERLIKYQHRRLNILEQEQEGFRQFEQQDKVRRTLQMLIYENELSQTKQKLTALELLRNEAGNLQTSLGQKLQSTQTEVDRYFRILNKTKMNISFFEKEKEGINHHYQRLITEKIKLTQTKLKIADKSNVNVEKELILINQIQESETELEEVNCWFDKVNVESDKKNHEIMLKEQQLAELYDKQNRCNNFSDRGVRDNWIRKKLESINKQITVKREHEDCLSKGIKVDIEIENKLVKRSEKYTQKMQQNRAYMKYCEIMCRDLNEKLELCNCIKTELLIKTNENLEHQCLLHLQEKLSAANENFYAKAGSEVVNGNESIQKVLSVFKERGGSDADFVEAYHGTLMDVFKCDEKLHTAVEVMAGDKLLYHIVDSDEVVTKIMNERDRMKLNGAVNFISMNSLNFTDVTYPNNKDAIPLIHQLSYEPKYDQVIRCLFREILICSNLDVATAMVDLTNLKCVTLKGDKVTQLGTFSGDYIDTSKLYLEIHSVRKELFKCIEVTTQELSKEIKSEQEIDNQINNISLEMQEYRSLSIELQVCIDQLDVKMLLLKKEMTSVQEVRASKEKALAKSQAELECLLATKQSLDLELEQDFSFELSESDQGKLNSLNEEIQILRKGSKEGVDDISKLPKEKNELDNFCVNNSFKKRKVDPELFQENPPFEKQKNKLSALDSELEDNSQKRECVIKDLAEKGYRIKKMLEQLHQAQIELTRLTLCKETIVIEIDKQSETLETFVSKQILLDHEIAEITVKINEVGGALSNDMYEQYSNLSLPSLVEEINNVTKLLEESRYANKNPVMQSEGCSIKLENLLQTKRELHLCLKKNQDLLVSVKDSKFQALLNAFEQISRNFTEVFKMLVPAGKAIMVMLSTDVEEGYECLPDTINMDNFVGVAIRVSFKDSEGPMNDMTQLSSGERLLVALGLIFAIQKFKPAPFYLFDKIDQGLDTNYRKVLARLIHELPDEIQFINIPCKPQLLKYANKFYKVASENNCSLVKCVTRGTAGYWVKSDEDCF